MISAHSAREAAVLARREKEGRKKERGKWEGGVGNRKNF
jgi:hypothetical protein